MQTFFAFLFVALFLALPTYAFIDASHDDARRTRQADHVVLTTCGQKALDDFKIAYKDEIGSDRLDGARALSIRCISRRSH